MYEDTIAAIATPPGTGGIAVIRVSGPLAETIACRLFRPRKPVFPFVSHHLYYGDIVSPGTGAILDEGMVCLMRGPHSYTGEDVLEIHCHGGVLLPQTVLSAVIGAGARPAEAGEFTRRAFLNGRIDLSQAEAIADVISSRTGCGLQAALSQLRGDLRRTVDRLVGGIADILAQMEADLDFSEDEHESPSRADLATGLQSIAEELRGLASSYDRGRLYRCSVSVVIAGRANVGKSSLLNRLLGENRAIVAPTPGTTRDFIEESIDLQGIVVRVTDTAGIRIAHDAVEQAGIDLVWERIAPADVVILVMDGSQALAQDDRDLLNRLRGKSMLLAINKTDLPHVLQEEDVLPWGEGPIVRISAKYDRGLDILKEVLYRQMMGTQAEAKGPATIITHLRHKLAVEKALCSISCAVDGALGGSPAELIAEDLRQALTDLQEIGGTITNDDILDRIFAALCVGK